MTSLSWRSFIIGHERANTLVKLSTEPRLKPIDRNSTRLYLHAGLAAHVASWDAYVKSLVDEFFLLIADPLDQRFSSHHTKLTSIKELGKRRLNTPNAENCREFMLTYTGYDPWGDWIWPSRKMSALDVRERLNEILRVRHSFAHGFAMPAYNWNTSASGDVRLTAKSMSDVRAFFLNLVERTEMGMDSHISQEYQRTSGWS